MTIKKWLRKIGLGRGEAFIADKILTGAADAATGGAVSALDDAVKAAKRRSKEK